MGDVIDASRRFRPTALDKILRKIKSIEVPSYKAPGIGAGIGLGALGLAGSLANNATKHHSNSLEYVSNTVGGAGLGSTYGQIIAKTKSPVIYSLANEAKKMKAPSLKGAAIGGSLGLLQALLNNKRHKKNSDAGLYDD